ncbi:hypothetical protein BU23DRAFT_234696 [Bimuria novae-zelandiae CBS 107.79]|uniref:Uncharacterized protein n=1 Tax=Bimuria novae-zelandiae CBS 107.79 TaxID=1447943 RepID=A0A6A5UWQ9_9PLEO|nr:hypothetical protein BU23DRAFT_234696 [Bimuria novae-zelandiae CBS 107.79]
MADLAVSTQLQQWSFEKSASVRPERFDSTASSPDLSHREPETLRLDAAAVRAATSMDSQDQATFQERYLSSEEALSPIDGNTSDDDYDSDNVSIHEAEAKPSFFKARTMSVSRWDKGKSCDLQAVTVSYVSAGRPKVIELAQSPVLETPQPQRTVSLAQLPIAAVSKLRQQDQETRRSLIVKSSMKCSDSAPAISIDIRRTSVDIVPYTHIKSSMKRSETAPAISIDTGRTSAETSPYTHSNKSAVHLSDSRPGSSLRSGRSTPRSSSPSVSEKSTASPRPVSPAPRSSLYMSSHARTNPLTPLTPHSPGPHAFLSSDPYENSTTNAASPLIKTSPQKRLRSISQKLSLARIAIAPAKKWDSRVNGRAGNFPPTPNTPYTPLTPQSAPLPTTTTSTTNKLRRNSRLAPSSSRPGTSHGARGPSPDIPPMPTITMSPQEHGSKKLVARGADEREPILELPPCPVNKGPSPMNSVKSRRIRKRKSLMDLL